MPTAIASSIAKGLKYLAQQQRTDGGFDGVASADAVGFTNTRLHPTIFFTALICQCCNEIKNAQNISEKGSAYLLRHKSKAWTWNYWQRDERGAQMQGYPDDLDDTACALAAIIGFDTSHLDGTLLGHIGRQLVAAEAAVGGPYETWLVPASKLDIWHDIDVAVNANIAYLLSYAEVMPPGLEHYLHDKIASDRLGSSYYIGDIPPLYFLARTGKHSFTPLLKRQIQKELRRANERNPLMTALLLAAGCRLGISKILLQPLAEKLVYEQQKDHWPACALYVEPPINRVPYYAGSATLTTAFACEALQLYSLSKKQPAAASSVRRQSTFPALQAARRWSQRIEHNELQRQYQQAIEAIAKRDTDGQISAMAQQFAADLGQPIPAAPIRHLDAGSLNGWIAYTLYDDILDGEKRAVQQLATANLALRQSLEHFRIALPRNHYFKDITHSVFATVDAANLWEITHARAVVNKTAIKISQRPDYGNFAQLADRSWGHVLASTGVLLAAGYTLEGDEITAWQEFFRHFLIGRQLNDDAHDWYEDLAAGHLTAVVCATLQDHSIPLEIPFADLPGLRQHFWETTITDVSAIITDQLLKAHNCLEKCDFLRDKTRYEEWLTKLQAAVDASRNGRAEALAFMRSFETAD